MNVLCSYLVNKMYLKLWSSVNFDVKNVKAL